MKIYTKTGDRGTTSLFGGERVHKNSPRIEAYGVIDELNSQIGVILAENPPVNTAKKLLRVQEELFVLGTDLASPLSVKIKVPRITKSYVTRLEKEIDGWNKKLPKLKNFILPGGTKVGVQLHLSRTIARRAERAIVDLASQEKISKNVLPYINRLSDWFFVLARYVNKLEGHTERVWKGRS